MAIRRDEAVQAACMRGSTRAVTATVPGGGRQGFSLAISGICKALALGLMPIPAVAATIVTSFGVTAMVPPRPSTCLVGPGGSVPGIHKGDPSPLIPAVSVKCSGTMPYEVSLEVGAAASAIIASQMIGHLAATWSYAPVQGRVQFVKWSTTGRHDPGNGPGGLADPTFIADVNTITATVRY